jgi:hypothetical protein
LIGAAFALDDAEAGVADFSGCVSGGEEAVLDFEQPESVRKKQRANVVRKGLIELRTAANDSEREERAGSKDGAAIIQR